MFFQAPALSLGHVRLHPARGRGASPPLDRGPRGLLVLRLLVVRLELVERIVPLHGPRRWFRRGGGARPGRLRGRPPRRARPAAAAAQELGFEAREQRLLAGGELVRERGVAERRLALLVRQRLAIGGGDRDAGEPRAGHPRPRPRERGVSTPGVADEMVFSSTSQVRWKSACPRKSRPKRRVVGGNESFRDGKTLAGTRRAPRANRGGSARDAVCLGVPHLPL